MKAIKILLSIIIILTLVWLFFIHSVAKADEEDLIDEMIRQNSIMYDDLTVTIKSLFRVQNDLRESNLRLRKYKEDITQDLALNTPENAIESLLQAVRVCEGSKTGNTLGIMEWHNGKRSLARLSRLQEEFKFRQIVYGYLAYNPEITLQGMMNTYSPLSENEFRHHVCVSENSRISLDTPLKNVL